MRFVPIKQLLTEKISGEWRTEVLETSQSSVAVIRTANFLNTGKINVENLVRREVEEKKVKKKKLITGDIIIEKSGGSPNQPVGRVVLFKNPDGDTYLCNNFTSILRPNKEIAYPGYLFYALFDNHLKGKTLRYQNKTTGIINLKLDNYLDSEIPLPPLDEQKRIAYLLSKVEGLIAQRKQHLQHLDDLLKSVFLEMFGDPVRNEKGWEKKLLQDLCRSPKDIKCGPFGTQLNKDEFQKNGVPVWGIPQINSEFAISPNDFVTIEKAAELDDYSVIHNDIVMSRKGTVGKCSIYPNFLLPGIMHSDVLRIRVDWEKHNPVYLCWQLRISRDIERQIANVSSGAIMAGINVGKLKAISLYIAGFIEVRCIQ